MIYLLTRHFPFFWDTIQLGAKQATHLYETGSWLLPDHIDSGHPPGFGWYLSLWWRVLGRELWVSHLAMAPWIWLFLQQLFRLGEDLIGDRWWLLALLVLCEPVLLGQIVLVSPDVVLVAAWMLGLRQILLGPARDKFYLFCAIIVLALVSTRGWVAALSLFLLGWLLPWWRMSRSPELQKKENRRGTLFFFGMISGARLIALFLSGGVLALSFLYYHYLSKGWIGYHPDSPWADSFRSVGLGGLLRNVGLIGWRWLDVGRIFLWLTLPLALYWNRRHRLWESYEWWGLATAALLFQLLLAPLILSHEGLTGPRYLLPAFLAFDLLVAYTLLFRLPTHHRLSLPLSRRHKIFYPLLVLAFASGNLWVYPHRIAQAWDATPAHIPYYAQVEAATKFLDERGIPLDAVATVFPSAGPRDVRQLNGESRGFSHFAAGEKPYYFVSLIHNEWTDGQLDFIESRPIVWQQRSWNGVWSRLYGPSDPSR